MMNRFGYVLSKEDWNPKRGSVLLSAVITTFIVALLTGSYLFLSGGEYRLASRNLLMGASFALAEGGIDQAIDALNKGDSTGWTVSGSTWTKEFADELNVTGGLNGSMRVVVLAANTNDPTIYSEGIVSGHFAGDVSKQIKVDLTRGFTINDRGLIVDLSTESDGSNVTVQAFDSRLGSGVPGDFLWVADGESVYNKFDTIRVSTASYDEGAIDAGNTKIYGYISTGGGEPKFGPGGGVFSLDGAESDPTRVSYDFYSNFTPEPSPDDSPDWVPTNTDLPLADESGIITIGAGQYELGGTSSILKTNGGEGGEDIEIDGDVVLVVTDGGSISIGGDLTIKEGGSLTVYTNGDLYITGNINNTGVAADFQIKGTNSKDGEQTIKLSGSAGLTAFVYAPTADVIIVGGGASNDDTKGYFRGAIVAYTAKLTGNMDFWFDLALADEGLILEKFDVIEWVELTNTTTETAKIDFANYL